MLRPIYPYSVAIRGMNYVIVDTRTGNILQPAYMTRNKAETECEKRNRAA